MSDLIGGLSVHSDQLKHELRAACAVYGGGILCAAGALSVTSSYGEKYHAGELRRCFDMIGAALEAYEAAVAANAEGRT